MFEVKEREVVFYNPSSGIKISYTDEILNISGYFDTAITIEGGKINLLDFCKNLKISSETLRKVAKEIESA